MSPGWQFFLVRVFMNYPPDGTDSSSDKHEDREDQKRAEPGPESFLSAV
jgi:hypothetical protein